MKKIVRQFVFGFAWMMITCVANAQHIANDNEREEKIRSLISQMTWQEKMSLAACEFQILCIGCKKIKYSWMGVE